MTVSMTHYCGSYNIFHEVGLLNSFVVKWISILKLVSLSLCYKNSTCFFFIIKEQLRTWFHKFHTLQHRANFLKFLQRTSTSSERLHQTSIKLKLLWLLSSCINGKRYDLYCFFIKILSAWVEKNFFLWPLTQTKILRQFFHWFRCGLLCYFYILYYFSYLFQSYQMKYYSNLLSIEMQLTTIYF